MSKTSAVFEVAQKTGVAFSKASKFIDDVGLPKAKKAADAAASGGSKTVKKWWKPATVTGVAGGGALKWRQQDVEKAKQIADKEQSQSEAIKAIMNSDLPPEVKREMIDKLLNEDGNNDGGNDGGGNPLEDLFSGLDMSGIQMTLGLVVVLVIMMQFGGGE